MPWSLFPHAITGPSLSDRVRALNSVTRSHLTFKGKKPAFHMLKEGEGVTFICSFFVCFEYVPLRVILTFLMPSYKVLLTIHFYSI